MAKQYFKHNFKVDAAIVDIVQFHQDPSALKQLTPPGSFLKLHTLEPLAENSIADFTLYLGFLPIRWIARHKDVNFPQEFTDVQEEGPFKSWRHRHCFINHGDSTEVQDEITLEFAPNFPQNLVGRFIWLTLPVLFAYRAWKTKVSIQAASSKSVAVPKQFE